MTGSPSGPALPVDDPPTNVLLRADPFDEGVDEACADLLAARPPSATDLLLVSLTRPPSERLRSMRPHLEGPPAGLGIVSADDYGRGTATERSVPIESPSVSIRTVPNPANLTKLGVTITDQLADWEDDDRQLVVCFDSLSTLLQQTTPKKTYQFLSTLNAQLRIEDAIAHYHVDPDAHDDRAVNVVVQLFDVLVDVDGGELDVRRR